MKLAVIGATGRTGREIVAEATDRGHDVIGIASEDGTVGDVPVRPAGELPSTLEEVDAVIDFSVPEAAREHVATAAEAGVPYVVGTTGFDEAGIEAMETASETIPVLKASNFARGVQTLLRLVEAGVEALPEYDIELTETHHSGKRDAPSGTANTILDVVDDAREEVLDRTHGRHGEHRREDSEVGVHVRRAGTVRGEHELMLAGNDEILTIAHRAESRRVFAAGAVDAAEWLADREPGRYEFGDVV